MKNLECLYREHPDVAPMELSKLSFTSYHLDGRWEWRDLPKIKAAGLWYPLLVYKRDPDWWHTTYKNALGYRESWEYIKDPIVNEDGKIWAVHFGNNRVICARYLGYTHIDCISFDNFSDLIKYSTFIKNEDPFHAP